MGKGRFPIDDLSATITNRAGKKLRFKILTGMYCSRARNQQCKYGLVLIGVVKKESLRWGGSVFAPGDKIVIYGNNGLKFSDTIISMEQNSKRISSVAVGEEVGISIGNARPLNLIQIQS